MSSTVYILGKDLPFFFNHPRMLLINLTVILYFGAPLSIGLF